MQILLKFVLKFFHSSNSEIINLLVYKPYSNLNWSSLSGLVRFGSFEGLEVSAFASDILKSYLKLLILC